MSDRIYDKDLEVWQATVETHQGQLQRCLPSLEREYRARRDAANKVVEAILHYKAICERIPGDHD